jgi:hypothetical protein
MEVMDGTKKYEKFKIAKGTLVSLQGNEQNAFYVLHGGLVELLCCDDLKEGENPESILDRSYRVGMTKGEALLNGAGLLEQGKPHSFSIRTVSDCIISSTPMTSEEMADRIQRDMVLNLKILKDMVARVESGFYLYRNYKYLWHKFALIADVLALGLGKKNGKGQENVKRLGADLEEYALSLAVLIEKDRDCIAPEEWDINLFLGQIQDKLKLYEDHDNLRIEETVDHRQYLFIKRIVGKNTKILSALFQRDEPLNQYVFVFLQHVQTAILNATRELSREICQLMDQIYREDGWAHEIIKRSSPSISASEHFLHYLTIFSYRSRKDAINLLGKDLFVLYPIFGEFKKYKDFTPPQLIKSTHGSENQDESRLIKYQGLLDKILDFSKLPDEFKNEFRSLMNEALEKDDLTASDKESQNFREKLSLKYWELYEHCFLQIIDSDLKGFIPGIMLHLGVVDERFLTKEELRTIDDLYAMNHYSFDPVPVMTLPYFLEKIYNSELNPSLTEMGDSFNSILKAQAKMTPKEKAAAEYKYKDTPEDRVHYEIKNVSRELYKILSGNKARALPFLCSAALTGDLSKMFMSSEALASSIESIRKRDYTLFFREVLFKHKNSSDIIQKEIIPYFIFYPLFGNRAVMWQEMDGLKKSTPGRIFYPLYFEGKKEDTLLELLASFRWELKKSIAGFNWTDPVEGGLVGAYYDYIQFYRKNPNITPEAKKRLADFIKRTKSDKDRFARDYMSWIIHEYEGRARLNSYARELFYRYCPFPLDKRTEMAGKPLYQSLETKFINRRQKEILRIKTKIKKMEKMEQPIPQDIVAYMEYLEMEE